MAPLSLLLTLAAFFRCVSSTVNVPTQTIAPGVDMPVVSIGTGGLEHDTALDIVSTWLGLGGRGIDTALTYQNQADVAKAIASSGVQRGDLFITTKVPGCSPTTVENQILEDLTLLETNYIDLLLIHFPSGTPADCALSWEVLEKYHASGVARAIGVSNFNVTNLKDLLQTAKVVPAVNQIELNILKHDDATIDVSGEAHVAIEAYSPLGRNSSTLTKNAIVTEIAAKYNVTTYQVAGKWILQHGHFMTFQSSSASHQEVDADLFGFELAEEDMLTLDSLQNSIII
jgi:diketogulonate reductase-like aldo/keto reductase